MHCHQHQPHSSQAVNQQRKHSHSHSPHPSRHTSPHSHHSHSLHSSPHQSQHRVHNHDVDCDDERGRETDSRLQHGHSHHHHRRRRRQNNHQHGHRNGSGGGGSGNGSGNSSTHGPHNGRSRHNHSHGTSCARRHRSTTDVSSTSINPCHDPICADREVQDILIRKSCGSSSRTELAQYFAEDLYGSLRRPSSCCTSSDYCYQTDSTSLYGSRSSLSRNNSIKSASIVMRKKRVHQRQPSYTSISLRGLNASHPNSQMGSLMSIFDRAKCMGTSGSEGLAGASDGSSKLIVSPSKVTIERQTSKDALSNDLPEYACSPSPIRWSFLADGKSSTDLEIPSSNGGGGETITKDAWKAEERLQESHEQDRELDDRRASLTQFDGPNNSWKFSYDERPSTSAAAAARKCRDSPFSCDLEESTTVLFHQEGEAFNNCCNNYIQCNTYLDQDLQITSEDIHQYLSKGKQQLGDVLNNSKSYPFQPSNALEFQYKNNFANKTNSNSDGSGRSQDERFRFNSSKETNLNSNTENCGDNNLISLIPTTTATSMCAGTSSSREEASQSLSPTNINLSSSTNNINIVFNSSMERNANEVKFINTARDNTVSSEAHHSGYLPYTFPSYDYTNMSANSFFDKTIGIDELPKELDTAGANESGGAAYAGSSSTATTSEGQHSSSLQSPVQKGASFESFDAASDRKLLHSNRDSCQFSPTSHSPHSPLSLASPASSSCLSASINPSATSYVQTHHPHYDYQQQKRVQNEHCQRYSFGSDSHQEHHNNHEYNHHCHERDHQEVQNHYNYYHPNNTSNLSDSSKLSNAFKKVRKRARKYTDFLRKK